MTSNNTDTHKKIEMYTQALCGYCAAAKQLLDSKGIRYENIDVTMEAGRRREMKERSGRKTVPQIFIDDQHIGGYDDIAALDSAGDLNSLLGIED